MCMKIALTNLGKYNEGILDFVWLELPASEEQIAAAFDSIQVSHDDIHYYSDGLGHVTDNDLYGEYEEFFITDYECDFMRIGEYANLEELNDLADQIENMDDRDAAIVKGLLDEGFTLEDAMDSVDDVSVYSGCTTMTDVAYEYVEECDLLHGVPDSLQNYFDYEAFGRDLSFDGHWFEVDGGLAVLWN